MQIELAPQDFRAVDALVATGRYASREAVVREAVRLLTAEEAAHARLVAKIDAGIADVTAGRVVDLDVAFDRLEARFAAKARAPT